LRLFDPQGLPVPEGAPASHPKVRPTQGKTLDVMEVSGGSHSFKAVNQADPRTLDAHDHRLEPKQRGQGLSGVRRRRKDEAIALLRPCRRHLLELIKISILTRAVSSYLTDRHSEHKEEAAMEQRVSLKSI
jgi:arsenic resistance protein ArsH